MALAQALIAVSPDWHRRLTTIAAAETQRTGRRVTLRALVEKALGQAYDDVADASAPTADAATPAKPTKPAKNAKPAPPATPPAAPVDSADFFAQLVDSAMQPDNVAIEAWGDKVVIGEWGKIKVKSLAYFLRTATTEIRDLDELMMAYYGGAA